jgi:hypothetical protein
VVVLFNLQNSMIYRILIVILSLLTMWSHSATAQQSPSESSVVPIAFKLDQEYFVILLPTTTTMSNLDGQVAFDLTKGRRLQRSLHFATAVGNDTGYRHQLQMTSGSVLEFKIKDNAGGGSGGPIAELTGIMQIGAQRLAVTCTDQDEWRREPDWCLPYLNFLVVAKSDASLFESISANCGHQSPLALRQLFGRHHRDAR